MESNDINRNMRRNIGNNCENENNYNGFVIVEK